MGWGSRWRNRAMRFAVAAVTAAVLLASGSAMAAVTVTVGRQSLTGFTNYFHCQGDSSTNCDNSFSPTRLTSPGDLVRLPEDGTIVAWRVVGACIRSGGPFCAHELRVLRQSGAQFTFVDRGGAVQTATSCDRCAPLDGSKIDITPGLVAQAGDYIGLSEEAVGNVDVRVMVAPATGAVYNLFSGAINNGSSLSPSPASGWEPLFNADVVLDPPVVTSVSAPSGVVTGGQSVTITGSHLSSVSQVWFGSSPALALRNVSSTGVTAVAPPHAAGPVDVTVTTLGGTSAPTGATSFTFVNGPSGGGRGSVYVANSQTNDIWQYGLGGGGLLTLGTPPAVPGAADARGLALSPDGRSVYVAGQVPDGNNVYQYDVGADGTLTPKAPGAIAGGTCPKSVAVTPDGRSVYITNLCRTDGSAGVSQYGVGAGGVLIPKSLAVVDSVPHPYGVAVSPDGHSAYVTSVTGAEIAQYDIGPDGTLTVKAPATVAAGTNPFGIAVSPDGRSVYVANNGSHSVSQYDVGAGGALSPKAPSTVQVGDNPIGIAVSPDGRSVYVANSGTDSVSQFDVGPDGGLTSKPPAWVGAGDGPSGVVVSPDGRSVFVTNGKSNDVSQYDVGAGGVLTPKAPQPTVAAGLGPEGISMLPDQGPVATFAAQPAPARSASGFDASRSTDPDGSVVRYDWDFGDGSAAVDAGPKPKHTFAAAGSYTVTLTVTDDSGCSTRFIFTGQTASCNGGAPARATLRVSVPAARRSVPPAKPRLARSRAPIKVDRRGRFKFSFRAGPNLRGHAEFVTTGKVRVSRGNRRTARVLLARKSFRVPAGGRVTLTITLSRNKLGILRLNGRLRVRAIVTVTNAAGLSSSASTTIRLRAP